MSPVTKWEKVVQSAPRSRGSPEVWGEGEKLAEPADEALKTKVQDLVSPVGSSLLATQPLQEAARRIAADGRPVAVLNLSAQPIGVITEADLDLIREQKPGEWMTRRCASLIPTSRRWVRLKACVEHLLGFYQRETICPLLALDGSRAVGVIYPSTVYHWCAAHYPAALDTLKPSSPEAPSW